MSSTLSADGSRVAEPHFRNERSTDIDACPDDVFPWLTQMGFGRAGWYSWDLIDNLGRRSATDLRPEWMVTSVGDLMPAGPIDFETLAVDEPGRLTIAVVDRTVGPWTITFVLDYRLESRGTGSRLTAVATCRIAGPGGRPFARWLLGPGDAFMVRRQLRGIRDRAEGRYRSRP